MLEHGHRGVTAFHLSVEEEMHATLCIYCDRSVCLIAVQRYHPLRTKIMLAASVSRNDREIQESVQCMWSLSAKAQSLVSSFFTSVHEDARS